MKLARDLERRIEHLVEGFTARVFRGRVQPVELATRLAREADLNLTSGPAGPVAPNYFAVVLHPNDVDDRGGGVRRELGGVVEEIAAERGWRLEGPVVVDLGTDPHIPSGGVDLASEIKPGPLPAWGHLHEVGGHRRLPIRHNRALVGRSRDADVVIGDLEVSRRHALIWREGGRAWLIDLSSANGTFVNGAPAIAPLPLMTGDVAIFGLARFTFRPT